MLHSFLLHPDQILVQYSKKRVRTILATTPNPGPRAILQLKIQRPVVIYGEPR